METVNSSTSDANTAESKAANKNSQSTAEQD